MNLRIFSLPQNKLLIQLPCSIPHSLQCLVKVKAVQSCPTLCDPMEFSRPEYWSEQLFTSSGDLPNPGIELGFPVMQVDSLPTELSGKPPDLLIYFLSVLICLFWIFHINKIIKYFTFVFKIYSHCSIFQYFICFTTIISLCDYHILFIHSSVDGLFIYLTFGYMSNAAMNSHVFVWIICFHLSRV